METEQELYDVIIIGGGPAGLSAALVLGRAIRKVLVCDALSPRNAQAERLHGFLSRDGVRPSKLLALGREELRKYNVKFVGKAAIGAECLEGGLFGVTLEDSASFKARKLLFTTGVVDVLPPIEGMQQFYGRGIYHCPYCDGWENRDRKMGVLSNAKHLRSFSVALKKWSSTIIALSNGAVISQEDTAYMTRLGIEVCTDKIKALEGTDRLTTLVFEDGRKIPLQVLFFHSEKVQRSPLPSALGCTFENEWILGTQGKQRSNIPGIYIAGDADGDVQFAVNAAAEGARAATALDKELLKEDLERIS